jgi:4-hydroxybenzoate polyprenyltransferase
MTTLAPTAALPSVLLRLGRVSNLPTVWTNVLAAVVLSGGDWHGRHLGLLLISMSLCYVGGMYLNDYFDRVIDARERPDRPIPSGAISAYTVATIGFVLLGCGFLLIAMAGVAAASVAAALLAAAVVAYDLRHKGNPFGPAIMGACRALVYVTAAALTGTISAFIIVAAVAVAAYVAGLTYAARQESLDKVGNLWPLALVAAPLLAAAGVFGIGAGAVAIYLLLALWMGAAVYLLAKRPGVGAVSRAVGWLIAGISLCDAALLASGGAMAPALMAIGGFLVTLVAQKYVAGT